MTENIDLLLEKLSPDSLAHKIVKLMKETERHDWSVVVNNFLKSRMEEKVKEVAHGKDQEARN